MLKGFPRTMALPGAKGTPLAPVSSRWAGPFSTGSCYEPVLKGSLTPGRKMTEVFSHFGHPPMSHSVVVIYTDSVILFHLTSY